MSKSEVRTTPKAAEELIISNTTEKPKITDFEKKWKKRSTSKMTFVENENEKSASKQ